MYVPFPLRPSLFFLVFLVQVVAFKQQTNIMNEKNVMMMVDHPFVLKLETTFKDANSLYMLLEFVQGGELFTLLANQDTGRLTIPHAKYVLVAAGVVARWTCVCVWVGGGGGQYRTGGGGWG